MAIASPYLGGPTLPLGKPKVVHYPGGVAGSVAVPVAARATAAVKPAAKPATDSWAQLYNLFKGQLVTPEQARKNAALDINTQIQGALKGYQASTAAEQAQANQQARRAQAFALALAAYGQPTADATAAHYQDAAHEIQGLGTGLTGAVADAQQARAAQTASAIDQMTGGGQGQITAYDIPAERSTDQMTGVVMPASDLYGQAANAARVAQGQTFATAQQVEDIVNQYKQKTLDAQASLAAQRAGLEAQRPALYRQAIQDATDKREKVLTDLASLVQAHQSATLQAQTARQSAKTAAAQLKVQQNYLTSSLNKNMGYDATGNLLPGWSIDKRSGRAVPPDYAIDPATGGYVKTSTLQAGTKAAADRAARYTSTNKYKSDASGNPVLKNGKLQPIGGYKLSPDGQNVVKIGTTKKTGGLSASGFQSALDSVNYDTVHGLGKAKQPTMLYRPNDPNADDAGFIPVEGSGAQAVQYPEALAAALAKRPAGVAPKVWAQRVKAVVDSHYQPGENGRPPSTAMVKAAMTRAFKAAKARGWSYGKAVQNAQAHGFTGPMIEQVGKSIYGVGTPGFGADPALVWGKPAAVSRDL